MGRSLKMYRNDKKDNPHHLENGGQNFEKEKIGVGSHAESVYGSRYDAAAEYDAGTGCRGG